MTEDDIKKMNREDKIKFLKRGQTEEPKYFNYDKYGDFLVFQMSG